MIPITFQTGSDSSVENTPWNLAEPTTPYDRTVVVAYGSDELVPPWKAEIEVYAKKLAGAGILALVPDYFEVDTSTPHGDRVAALSSILPRHNQRAQMLRDAVATTKALHNIDSSKVGLLGFSPGGFLALRIRDSVDALVENSTPYRFAPNVDLGPETPLKQIGPRKTRHCTPLFTTGKPMIWYRSI